MQKQTHPVHFEDFSGQQFERLCFAFVVRLPHHTDIDWYGQLGNDRGHDIICANPDGSFTLFQCANYRRLSLRKVVNDLTALAAGPHNANAHFHLICGGPVSGKLKDKVRSASTRIGFLSSTIWSGAEFEEQLRILTPELLLRFIEGTEFPELASELIAFSKSAKEFSDHDIIVAFTSAFDRPAFRTPFRHESSLPRFKAAIAETIATLNTGRTPQGAQLPAKNDVRDTSLRRGLSLLVEKLVALRAAFDDLMRKGDIKHCGCKDPDCPVFMFTDRAIQTMDMRRRELLRFVHELNPSFEARFYWMD